MISKFISANKGLIIFLILVCICFFLFLFGLNIFDFLNNDEMNYVLISSDMLKSHDFFTPKFNGQVFFEKPPFYFYLTAISLKFCHSVNAIKYFVGLLSVFMCFFIYFVSSKLVSKRYGFFTALIFSTSLGVLLFSKIAFFELFFIDFVTLSIIFGICAIFVSEKNKKYFWWLMYIVSAFATMIGGITGISVPLIVLFFSNLFIGNIKEFFKPLNIGIGLFLYLLIVSPWHVIMLKFHGFQFFKEYFLTHHFGSLFNHINSVSFQSFDYYVWIIMLAFLPWIVFLIPNIIDSYFINRQKMKNYLVLRGFRFDFINYFKLSKNLEKLLIVNIIYFLTVFLYFSFQKVKLPEYVLFFISPLSFISAYFWYKYNTCGFYEKSVKFATLIFNGLLICFAALVAFLPYLSAGVVQKYAVCVQIPLSVLLLFIGILGIFFAFLKKRFLHFFSYVVLMSGFVIIYICNILYVI